MLSVRDILKELVFPLRSSSAMLGFGLFMLLIMLVSIARFVSPVLGFAVSITVGIAALPAVLRFLLSYLNARARGRLPEPMEADHFSWMSDRWGLFPLPLFAASGWLLYKTYVSAYAWAYPATLSALVLVLPASLIVLTMTHSPLQAVHPAALMRLVVRVRASYWLAPASVLIAYALISASVNFPLIAVAAISLYCVLVCCGIFGAVLRPGDMADDVDLPQVEVDVPDFSQKTRESALNLAYSFMSRDGVDNGIKHIESAIKDEGDNLAAWRWYFERMLAWENPFFACRFAQRYVKELLIEDDAVGLAKLIMRCQLLDERFKPLREDMPATIALLEQSGNMDLVTTLRR